MGLAKMVEIDKSDSGSFSMAVNDTVAMAVLALVLLLFLFLGYQFYKVQASNAKAEAEKKRKQEQKKQGAARGRGRTSELASHGSLIQEGQECWAGAFRARCPRAAKGIVYCQPDSAGLSHVSKLQQRLSVPMDQ